MILVLGRIPKLNNALYLTNSLKSNTDPCIDIEKRHIHLLFKSLQLDNLISIGDIHDMEKIIAEAGERISLKQLEALSDRHWELFQHLRGYFRDYREPREDNIVLPFIPGLEHTSLLQLLVFSRENYVVDLRFNQVNRGFLYSILESIDGELYIVSNNLDAVSDEIIVGEVNISTLRNLSNEPYKLLGKRIALENGRYRVKGDAEEFHRDSPTYLPRYIPQEPVDVLSLAFKSGERDYSNDMENLLYGIWSDGGITEDNLINSLMEIFGDDYIVRVALYLLLRYGLLNYITTPAGRQYLVSQKAMRILLERDRARREGRGE